MELHIKADGRWWGYSSKKTSETNKRKPVGPKMNGTIKVSVCNRHATFSESRRPSPVSGCWEARSFQTDSSGAAGRDAGSCLLSSDSRGRPFTLLRSSGVETSSSMLSILWFCFNVLHPVRSLVYKHHFIYWVRVRVCYLLSYFLFLSMKIL
ncbi:hypothetical protein EYF80_059342 [Liparis tanakae]|uniref:Uncharacterized protein n=1 Tax=Liparis tanakae TaxID=230148 RepID=A0A4Z2EP17_9TELE|nr:hypothetical protein EYF80_059342 [Liparis tanakae]